MSQCFANAGLVVGLGHGHIMMHNIIHVGVAEQDLNLRGLLTSYGGRSWMERSQEYTGDSASRIAFCRLAMVPQSISPFARVKSSKEIAKTEEVMN